MHNATLLIYDSAVYLGGDRAKVCSLWLHCCTGRAGLSLWNEGVPGPALCFTDGLTYLRGVSSRVRHWDLPPVDQAEIYRIWHLPHALFLNSMHRLDPCAAGKIVSLIGGGGLMYPAAMIAHLTHTHVNKQTHKVIQDHSNCYAPLSTIHLPDYKISIYSAGRWKDLIK